MKAIIRNKPVAMRAEPDGNAPIREELTPGREIELGQACSTSAGEWVEIRLPDDQRGYIPGDTEIIKITRRALYQPRALLRNGPAAKAAVVLVLKAGAEFELIGNHQEEGKDWVEIRLPDGSKGFVDGDTRIREVSSGPLPAWLASMGGGANLILTIGGGVGAIVLAVHGQWLEALALLAVCIVSGGLAGLVHYWTSSLRMYEFGPHLSWVLVFETYLLTVSALILLSPLVSERLRTGDAGFTFDPLFHASLLAFGVVGGTWFGYSEQRGVHRNTGARWSVTLVLLPALGAIGALLMIAGGLGLWYAWRDWDLYAEAREPPQDITIEQLLDKRHVGNRYLRLRDFRFCDKDAVENVSGSKDFEFRKVWVPAVPGRVPADAGPLGLRGIKPPPVPAKTLVVLKEFRSRNTKPRPPLPLAVDPERISWARTEREGYEGMLFVGSERLNARVRTELLELAPETDLAHLLVLDSSEKPLSASDMLLRREGGGAGLAGGLLLVIGVISVARRVERRLMPQVELPPGME
jgi:hypothetical protein